MNLDVVVFAAHPDDTELAMGGTVAKLSAFGKKVGVVDLSAGEMGSRGTVATRKAEADKASQILGITVRENLKLPDGNLRRSEEFVKDVVSQIRKYKPKIIFAPYFNDRHPDHIGTSQIVKEAMFFSGVHKFETSVDGKPQQVYRPDKLYYFMQTYEFDPSFVVDISDTFETKMKAVKAYGTQFFNEKSEEPETFISQANFMNFLEARAKYFGFKIGKDWGEPFFCEEKIEINLESLF
jgi:bacillithiol biosynthesis deacetylase BshB1